MNKLLVLILVGFCFTSCEPEPEFFVGGIGYYTRTRCVEKKSETKWGYHYGYDFMDGKYRNQYGSYTETTCIRYRTDTIAIVKD